MWKHGGEVKAEAMRADVKRPGTGATEPLSAALLSNILTLVLKVVTKWISKF